MYWRWVSGSSSTPLLRTPAASKSRCISASWLGSETREREVIQPDAKGIEVILAWGVRIGHKQRDQYASHRDEHRCLCFPHQGAAEGIYIKTSGPREISDAQTHRLQPLALNFIVVSFHRLHEQAPSTCVLNTYNSPSIGLAEAASGAGS
jgi:hypothetical protein